MNSKSNGTTSICNSLTFHASGRTKGATELQHNAEYYGDLGYGKTSKLNPGLYVLPSTTPSRERKPGKDYAELNGKLYSVNTYKVSTPTKAKVAKPAVTKQAQAKPEALPALAQAIAKLTPEKAQVLANIIALLG